MEGNDDVGLEDAIVGEAVLFDDDESFKREQICFGVIRCGADLLDRPSVGKK